MNKGPVLALAALVCLPVMGATAPGTTFSPPPFHVGEVARYVSENGSLNLTILPLAQAYDRAGRETTAFPIAYDDNGEFSFLNVSVATMRAESFSPYCPWRDRGGCRTVFVAFNIQGVPAAFGASLLQGQSFSIGDEWDAEGECRACLQPIHVRIEGPAPSSPAGTLYVVAIDGPSARPDAPWLASSGRLHMGVSTAFPLLFENDGGATYALVASEAGGAVIDASDVQPPSYPAPFAGQVVPFTHGHPAEGNPLPGHPSWAEARAATGTDPSASDSTLRFVSLEYNIGERWGAVNNPVTREQIVRVSLDETTVWNAWYKTSDGGDRHTTYSTTKPFPDVTRPLPLPRAWTASATPPTWDAREAGDCERASAPFWDGVRFGLSFPYVPAADFQGAVLSVPCSEDGDTFLVSGRLHPPDGMPYTGFPDQITFDAKTGLLNHAIYTPDTPRLPLPQLP